jgi:hypothetical protein
LNPYIQHVLPGFQLPLVHSTTTTIVLDDHSRSAREYWYAVEDNVPNSDVILSCNCVDSYGINILAMMFAFAYAVASGYSQKITLELSIGQALALHQANGLVDAVSYVRASIPREDRVILFGKFYRPLASLYEVVSTYKVLFVLVAIGVDILHHFIHILATIFRFLIVDQQPSVACNKMLYHLFHWSSLWVSFCTNLVKNDAPLNKIVCENWSLSHEYERMGHMTNSACVSGLS